MLQAFFLAMEPKGIHLLVYEKHTRSATAEMP